MFAAPFAASAAMLLAANSGSIDAGTATQLCLDSRLRKKAAELIADWSENYPFSRVIIGPDGRLGYVGPSTPAVTGSNYVVCAASYSLTKLARNGQPYIVTMDRFYFRITVSPNGYRVSLEDLPTTLEGSDITSRELIGRFKIDGRPYADILAENQRRVEGRGQ